jgi:LPXTG-motif cell wall-anchored protein
MNVAVKAGLLAALCLALWPALVGAAPPPPQGKLVYEDDFSTKTKSGLEDNLRATDYSRGFHNPGVYHLIMLQPNETKWAIFPNQSYSNFSYQIEVVDNSDDFSGSVSQGVVVRAQDASHLYAVMLDSRKGQYAVRKLDGSTWSDIIAFKPSKLIKPQDGTNVLRVDGNNDTFTVYLNGEQLDTFKDASYKKGGLGMIQANVDATKPHAHYDNVKIYTTDAPATGQPTSTNQPAQLPTTGQAESDLTLAFGALAFALLLLGLWVRQRR